MAIAARAIAREGRIASRDYEAKTATYSRFIRKAAHCKLMRASLPRSAALSETFSCDGSDNLRSALWRHWLLPRARELPSFPRWEFEPTAIAARPATIGGLNQLLGRSAAWLLIAQTQPSQTLIRKGPSIAYRICPQSFLIFIVRPFPMREP
jgi:hypothetical protein